ncbi:sulfotransferase 1A3-like [Amphiura filiformis]|uniref:sulfotransferase 1A3-like n=1 Tax=Amphiura filiformis TaxID=82378 RepID=UPI003B20C8D1
MGFLKTNSNELRMFECNDKKMEEVLGSDKIKELLEHKEYKEEIVMHEYKGVIFPLDTIKPSVLQALETWEARPEDVFVVSYAKAGTTWIQEVVSAIANGGDLEKLNKSHTFFRVPFIEATFFAGLDVCSCLLVESHLPGHLLPPDVFKKKARIVYVTRNPKDMCVSYYYFHIMNPTLPTPKSWNEFFDDFYSGKIMYGPWWEHFLFYWNLRHEPNVLFVKFEDMKMDLKAVVERVSKFMGYTISDDVINGIVDHCSFASMKKNPMTNPDGLFDQAHKKLDQQKKGNASKEGVTLVEPKQEKISFMRKGKVGDWRNHFTVAQNEAFDAFVHEKLAGSGLSFDF